MTADPKYKPLARGDGQAYCTRCGAVVCWPDGSAHESFHARLDALEQLARVPPPDDAGDGRHPSPVACPECGGSGRNDR